ncbi:MAG TPA: sulfite exporter TauE/SafE family protein [Myxococcaceae bacterium]|nr:sulfite exporter TauE/SafE family protein [Myxococcaceae bacterium]
MTDLLLIAIGLFAGGLGAMLGIGGGILLVPILVLGMRVPMESAVSASLLCVVATSCGAAANYVEHRLADVRLALTLEVATVSGAIAGGFLAAYVEPSLLALAFGLFLLYVAVQLYLGRAARDVEVPAGGEAVAVNVPLGMAGSLVAGGLSALLGVGGGPLKIPLMNLGMKVPFKIATATSNLMIGVTAAASVAAYAIRGRLDLQAGAPLVVGVLAGSVAGSMLMPRVPTAWLKRVFSVFVLVLGAQMLWKGGTALWPRR